MNWHRSPNRPQSLGWLVLLLSLAALAGCATSTSKKPSKAEQARLALVEQHQLAAHKAAHAFWAGKKPILTLPYGKLWAEKRDGSTYSGHIYFIGTGDIPAPTEVSAETATVANGELSFSQLHLITMGGIYAYPSTVEPTTLRVWATGSSVSGPIQYVTNLEQPLPALGHP